jgi:hypothetical protein
MAAICTKVFNLSDLYSTVYMLWYVREASTAVYVSNVPMIWPLLREWFPYLKNLTPGQSSRRAKNMSDSKHRSMRMPNLLKGSLNSSKWRRNVAD